MRNRGTLPTDSWSVSYVQDVPLPRLLGRLQTLAQTHNMNKPKKTCVVETVNPKAVTGDSSRFRFDFIFRPRGRYDTYLLAVCCFLRYYPRDATESMRSAEGVRSDSFFASLDPDIRECVRFLPNNLGDELYGYMTLAKDWKDGVLSIIMRGMSKNFSDQVRHVCSLSIERKLTVFSSMSAPT